MVFVPLSNLPKAGGESHLQVLKVVMRQDLAIPLLLAAAGPDLLTWI